MAEQMGLHPQGHEDSDVVPITNFGFTTEFISILAGAGLVIEDSFRNSDEGYEELYFLTRSGSPVHTLFKQLSPEDLERFKLDFINDTVDAFKGHWPELF